MCLSHPTLPPAVVLVGAALRHTPNTSALERLQGLRVAAPQKLPVWGLRGDSETDCGPPQAVILLQVRADFPSDKAASGLEVTVPFPRAVQRVSCEPEREPKPAHSQVAPCLPLDPIFSPSRCVCLAPPRSRPRT